MIHKHTEDGCDKGAHQSYLETERNTAVAFPIHILAVVFRRAMIRT